MDGLIFFHKELKTFRFPYYLPNNKLRQLARRTIGFEGWMKGDLTLNDAFQNLLPARFKKEGVGERLWEYTKKNLDALFARNGLYDAGYVSLFGHAFYPAQGTNRLHSWLDTFKTVSEAIVCDQYHAQKSIKEDSVVIDAGANIGAFSVFAAHLAPKGRIYCFEPTPETFAILQKNTREYPHITLFPMALGETKKNIDLIINEGAQAANTLADSGMLDSHSAKHFGRRVSVRVTTIDALGLERVDFIKMDAEGYEKQIIEGARHTIKTCSPLMSLSAYHRPGDKKDIPALVRSIDPGYKFNIDARSEEDIFFWKDT